MKVLITGGAGFIGSALIRRLTGHERVCYDNYSTGKESKHVDGVRYLRGDTSALEIAEEFDWIFHLGEYSRIATSFDDFDLVQESNAVGTSQILKLWKRTKAKLIYAGSSSIFSGEFLSPYTLSKANNCRTIKACGEWFGLPFVIAYFYNVFGRGQIESGPMATVIGIFEKAIREGHPLPVVSPGTQRRVFTHIDDVVDGLILLAERGEGEYGLTGASSYSMFDLVGQRQFQILPERRGERFNSIGDGHRARELGWTPRHDVLDYLKAVRPALPED